MAECWALKADYRYPSPAAAAPSLASQTAKPPPGLSISNQPQPKGLPQRVTRLQQRGITLTAQQVTQSVPSRLKRELKSFHQPLLFALIQRRWLEEGFQLRQGFLVVDEAL